jgi:hypothetical protein
MKKLKNTGLTEVILRKNLKVFLDVHQRPMRYLIMKKTGGQKTSCYSPFKGTVYAGKVFAR